MVGSRVMQQTPPFAQSLLSSFSSQIIANNGMKHVPGHGSIVTGSGVVVVVVEVVVLVVRGTN